MVREGELIDVLREEAATHPRTWLPTGLGDDVAEVLLDAGNRAVLTSDMVVGGLHFEEKADPSIVGWKAIARSVSDLAGSAAFPRCTIASVKFPGDADSQASRTLVVSLAESADEMYAPLAGGDISIGGRELVISVTAVGVPGPAGTVLRRGARPGDALCVTGSLGGSIRGHHLTFRPRTEEAIHIVQEADVHAMIDISDGLATDAMHVAEESGVGLRLESDRIPISTDAVAQARETGREPLWHALNDGEDYELLFAVPPADAERLERTGVYGLQVTTIGTVTAGKCELVGSDGAVQPLEAAGWEHASA